MGSTELINPQLLSILQTAGAGVIPLLGLMWWLAEKRASAAITKCEAIQDKSEKMAREMITAMVKTDETLRTVISIFTGQKTS